MKRQSRVSTTSFPGSNCNADQKRGLHSNDVATAREEGAQGHKSEGKLKLIKICLSKLILWLFIQCKTFI